MSCGACWAFAVAVVKLCEYVCTIWTCGNVYVTFLLSLWELSLITYCAKDKASSPHWGYIVKVFLSMLMRSEGDLEIILRWVESKGKWLDQNQFKYNKCSNSWLYFEFFFCKRGKHFDNYNSCNWYIKCNYYYALAQLQGVLKYDQP